MFTALAIFPKEDFTRAATLITIKEPNKIRDGLDDRIGGTFITVSEVRSLGGIVNRRQGRKLVERGRERLETRTENASLI